MIHVYEMDAGRGDPYWEVYSDEFFASTLQGQNEFDLYLDICRHRGVDFVIHTKEEYDEYHLSVPSV